MSQYLVVQLEVIASHCDSNILPPLYVGQGLGDAAIAPQFAYTHSTLYQTNSGEKSETHEIRHLVRPYTNTCTHGRTLTTLYQKTLENTQWRKQMQSGLGDDAVAPQQTNIPPTKWRVFEMFSRRNLSETLND